jgi:hypothetical protein
LAAAVAIAVAVGVHTGADALLAKAESGGPDGEALPLPGGLQTWAVPWAMSWTVLAAAIAVGGYLVYQSFHTGMRRS